MRRLPVCTGRLPANPALKETRPDVKEHEFRGPAKRINETPGMTWNGSMGIRFAKGVRLQENMFAYGG